MISCMREDRYNFDDGVEWYRNPLPFRYFFIVSGRSFTRYYVSASTLPRIEDRKEYEYPFCSSHYRDCIHRIFLSRVDQDRDRMDRKPRRVYRKLELSRRFPLSLNRVSPDHRSRPPWDECDDPRRWILGKDAFHRHHPRCKYRSHARELARILARKRVWSRNPRGTWWMVLTLTNGDEDSRPSDREKWCMVYHALKVS